MATALDDSIIKQALARPQSVRRTELVDGAEVNLRLRLQAGGAKWSLVTRAPDGTRLRIPLGDWPGVPVTQARAMARTLKSSLGAGEEGSNPTVGQLLDRYRKRHLSQLRKGDVIYKALANILSTVRHREPASLTRRELSTLIDDMADRAPIHANRVLAYEKAFFSWAVGRGHIEMNPAAGISKPTREIARERTPSLKEVVRIWRAAGDLGYPFGPIVRLLILTASRRDEVGSMRPEELKIGDEDNCWTLPAGRSKNGRAMRVPLSDLAVQVVRHALLQRPANSPFLFSTLGDRPVSGWSKAKRRLDAIIKAQEGREGQLAVMVPWRFHDLRRSFATSACDSLGIDPVVADRCLNHVGASTTSTVSRIYGRSEMFDQRRSALVAWAGLLEREGAGLAEKLLRQFRNSAGHFLYPPRGRRDFLHARAMRAA